MTRHETRLPTLMKRTDGSTDPISCAKAKTNGRRKLLKRTTDGEERSCTTLTLVNKEDSQVVPNVSRFSSWTRLLRSTARVLQAIDLFRVKRKVNALKHKRTATKTSSDPTWKHISKKAHTPARKTIEDLKRTIGTL
ncbi:hypothetical protein EVAR_13515_1 [Eumeta japonica]|uniref:Uncharacterized protein n=1 Tax=Eumeta variegata TaxID=151549 RepID=A0A4C1U8M1_EUMVA|nr:hypothetical protein EVAR_13515_1 [Eumeta japonica]